MKLSNKELGPDEQLDLAEGLGKNDLQRAMDDHILDRAELIGLYTKE